MAVTSTSTFELNGVTILHQHVDYSSHRLVVGGDAGALFPVSDPAYHRRYIGHSVRGASAGVVPTANDSLFGSTSNASDVVFDPEGLTGPASGETDVQGAIAALDAALASDTAAEDVTYDNTDSGLEATDVQGAIDELAGASGGIARSDVRVPVVTLSSPSSGKLGIKVDVKDLDNVQCTDQAYTIELEFYYYTTVIGVQNLARIDAPRANWEVPSSGSLGFTKDRMTVFTDGVAPFSGTFEGVVNVTSAQTYVVFANISLYPADMGVSTYLTVPTRSYTQAVA